MINISSPYESLLARVLALTFGLVLLAGCATEDVSKAANKLAATTESSKANAMFDRFFEQWVARSPSYQTYLGRKIDNDKWDDLSASFEEETLALTKLQLEELDALDLDALDKSTALSYQLMRLDLENEIEDYQWRLHNYPVHQMNGEHSGVPSLLINQHRIDSLDDAKAYIARVNAIPAFFAQLIESIERRTAAGIVPPKFVFEHVIRDCKNLLTGAPFDDGDQHILLTDFQSKIEALSGKQAIPAAEQASLNAELEAALQGSLKPGYQQLIAHLQQLQSSATDQAGVWKWPNGEAFFDVALQRTTTTELSASDIHELGLSEVKRIHQEMRGIKDTVGFKGDLAEFMSFMRDDKQFYYSSDEAGKQRYLSEARALIETMKTRLDDLFLTKPVAGIEVKAVEAFREQSAGKAFYQRPSEDGSRPGLYYANLYDMKAMPSYQMEALAYHEGIPGHHMQLAIAQELKDVPKFRKLGGYTAYVEGWGLYSEMIPKEIGFYSDPYSDFGRLAMELWRACRLVVDTGIHAKKWTREQGIAFYSENTPNPLSDVVKMVERHIVMPSQATAYKVGMLKILELREHAKAKLGDKFDIRGYHDEVLKYGPLPLNVLERIIEEWIAAQSAAT